MNRRPEEPQTEKCERLIDTPEGAGRFAAVRMEYMALCNGDPCAAAILNELEFLTSCQMSDGKPEGEVWVRGSWTDWDERTWGLFNEKRLKATCKWLTDMGYAERKFLDASTDKSYYYRFDRAAVQASVDWWHADYAAIGNGFPMDEEQVPDGPEIPDASGTDSLSMRNGFPMDEEQVPDASGTGSPSLKSLIQESSPEGIPEVAAETRAGAREAAAADPPVPGTRSKIVTLPGLPPRGSEPTGGGERVEAANIFALFRQVVGVEPDGPMCDLLAQAHALYTAEEIAFAFGEAVGHGHRKWSYVKAILERQREERQARERLAAEVDAALRAQAARWAVAESPEGRVFGADPEAESHYHQAVRQVELSYPSVYRMLREAQPAAWDSGGRLTFTVVGQWARDQLANRMIRNLEKVFSDVFGQDIELVFDVAEQRAGVLS